MTAAYDVPSFFAGFAAVAAWPCRKSTLTILVACLQLAHGRNAEEFQWLPFPTASGTWLVHQDCVHRMDADFHVESLTGRDRLSRGGARDPVDLLPCPHAPRWLNASRLSYYSDWVAFAHYTLKGGFGYMSSDWTVPQAPKSTGPVPGISSVYFFNGLEDSGGKPGTATYILQPVLSYGKSGCIIDPLLFFQWHLVSFYVTSAGRAYCSPRLHVEVGERVRGVMRLGNDGTTWTVESTRLVNNQTSTNSVNLNGKIADTAYLTLETMVNYGCNAFPASGSLTFANNRLADRGALAVTPKWSTKVYHSECNQNVVATADGSVTISWDEASLLI